MADVKYSYQIHVKLHVDTGSSITFMPVTAEGPSVAEAFDTAMSGLAAIVRPSLVAQDEMRETARQKRQDRHG